jgi:uncharacterized repeat protein (TIGR02543 family)
MSHLVQKNVPRGIKNRAVWHLPFLYKWWYNFSHWELTDVAGENKKGGKKKMFTGNLTPQEVNALIAGLKAVSDGKTLIHAVMTAVAASINHKSIADWVTTLQNNHPDKRRPGAKKDAVFANITNTKAAKTAAINGLYGLAPGVISIPATMEKIAAQWTTTAQVAWAVACLYGKRPASLDVFTMDLMSIVAGKEMVKDAAKEVGKQIADVGADALRAAFSGSALQKQLCVSIGGKLTKVGAVGAVFGAAKDALGLLGPVMAIKDAIDGAQEITKVAREARAYYYKFPKPEGTYIWGVFGAALDFKRDGSVGVRPYRGYDQYKKVQEIPVWVTLGAGDYVVDNDSITITFGKVSWKESNWNGSPPSSSGRMNYIDVEKKLSNKVVKGRITGDELLNLDISSDGSGGDWVRVDPVPPICTINYNANGGTPVPASRALNSGSPYPLPSVAKPGYVFNGWFTEPNGGNKIEPSMKVTDHCTLYAVWQLKNITVTLNAAGGSVPSPSSKIITFGSAYGALPYISRDKFSFVGWFNSRGEQVGNSTTLTDPNNHTLTARWTAIPQAPAPKPAPAPAPAPKPAPAPTPVCTVTFHRNGAPCNAIPQKTGAYNSRISLPSPPTWPGHTFVGWNTSGHGTGTAFTGTIPNTPALAVYAIWK